MTPSKLAVGEEKIIFRKVSVAMNRDEKYLALSPIPPCGRGLWHHLLFGPHITPLPGLSLIGRAAMAEELGWSPEAFGEAFREVFDQGLAKADWEARVVWLPNALKHNLPQSPNVIRGWRKFWDEIPDCPVKLEAFRSMSTTLQRHGEDGKFLKKFEEDCRKPSGKPFGKSCAKPQPKPSPEVQGKNDSKVQGNQRAGSREQGDPFGDPSHVVEPGGLASHPHAREGQTSDDDTGAVH